MIHVMKQSEERTARNGVDLNHLVIIRDWLTRRIEEERNPQTTASILERKANKVKNYEDIRV